jgi:hypothetical protein
VNQNRLASASLGGETMKRLIISIKSSSEALADFKSALKKARQEKQKPFYEISFDNRKDFDRFVRNLKEVGRKV